MRYQVLEDIFKFGVRNRKVGNKFILEQNYHKTFKLRFIKFNKL
jgi:hypothetical protein